jgi:phosphomethylpyrimidine synthase
MNIHDPKVTLPKVTTGSLPASRKVYSQPEAAPDLRVPLREIALDASSGEAPLPVYDTTGPYTDPSVTIDVEKGLTRTRSTMAMPAASIWRAISPTRRSRGAHSMASRSHNSSGPKRASSPRK